MEGRSQTEEIGSDGIAYAEIAVLLVSRSLDGCRVLS
jgi:hypothetical protein